MEEYTADKIAGVLKIVVEAYPQGITPYSPVLNMVEGLWKWIKFDVVNNVFLFENELSDCRVFFHTHHISIDGDRPAPCGDGLNGIHLI